MLSRWQEDWKMDVLPLDYNARNKATNSVSDNSRDQMSPSVSHRDLCCDLEVQGYGTHYLDTILAFNARYCIEYESRGAVHQLEQRSVRLPLGMLL